MSLKLGLRRALRFLTGHLSVYHLSEISEFQGLFRSIGLDEDAVAQLHGVYKRAEKKMQATPGVDPLRVYELVAFFELKLTTFCMRLFARELSPSGGSSSSSSSRRRRRTTQELREKTVRFDEFVLVLWDLCTRSAEELVVFAFELYDRDHDGRMPIEDVEEMVTELYASCEKAEPPPPHIIGEAPRAATLEKKKSHHHQNHSTAVAVADLLKKLAVKLERHKSPTAGPVMISVAVLWSLSTTPRRR